jgi:mono-ADP-ribosyltransferase sirtuin 6
VPRIHQATYQIAIYTAQVKRNPLSYSLVTRDSTMASTATFLPELSETPEAIGQKAAALAELIRTSKHFIAFTGAGVSTSAGMSCSLSDHEPAAANRFSAGIPDFRGPEGAWTLRAQGRQRTGKTISTLQAMCTPTHMALAELSKRGILKHLVSQNCDGLHRKSGIHPVGGGVWLPVTCIWY